MNNLIKPKNQVAECLYELISYKRRSRLDIMNATRMLCVTSKITALRQDYNLGITTNWVTWENKFGRMVRYAEWSIDNMEHAIQVYSRINHD